MAVLSRIRIVWRTWAIVAFPLFAIFGGVAYFNLVEVEKLAAIERAYASTQAVGAISELAHQLQRERGMAIAVAAGVEGFRGRLD